MTASKIYRMSAGQFGRRMWRMFRPWWVWLGIAAAVAGIIAGILADVRWAIAGFMVLMVIMPPALAFTYYSHALCRECFINTSPHTVTVRDDMLVVTLYIPDEEKEGEWKAHREEVFPHRCITGWRMEGNDLTVGLRDRHRGFLWISPAAYDEERDFADFADWSHKAAKSNGL